MAALSSNDRAAEWAAFMRDTQGAVSLTKAELRAAVDAIDDWVDANATAFNQAIPQPARGALTARQKARLLEHIVRRRFEVA